MVFASPVIQLFRICPYLLYMMSQSDERILPYFMFLAMEGNTSSLHIWP